MLSGISHIFFDLDGTLWDLNRNSSEVLTDLYDKFSLDKFGNIDLDKFLSVFIGINHKVWALYRQGKLSRERLRILRFEETLSFFGIEHLELSGKLSETYLQMMPNKTNLQEGTVEILEYLKPKYNLHIITNGFSDVQMRKLNNAGIEPYFKEIVTAEGANAQKPNALIFEYAFNKSGATANNSIMIGDEWPSDIAGAVFIKMACIWINHGNLEERPPGYDYVLEIHHLDELRNHL